ncbi:TetR/AcrR family transcriptional regulator [Actinomadura sp. KC216]|uniref:TetR/AcrR family transcriptional regulator n=1 Tax=Actinomadura sp. KC216 TaxID=2530370 RepID=UPI00104E930F|nr:TetR/AcrR family transcriptional regulator [Actinomadura sp. KC216]TDB90255.1 TetR/AcrR family transcriptional regulator [Actinomadura sp. KC216]
MNEETAAPSAYALAQRQGDRAIRTTILDAASRLLAAEGSQALALRRIAAEVGCSTTVLYRMFGGKAGLTEALFIEGFERFRQRLAAVPRHPDPRDYVRELGRAYRANALAERNYYGLMFGETVPGFQPGEEAMATAASAYAVLEDAVAACAAAGLLIDAAPGHVAASFWAGIHGFVSLELGGHLDDPEAILDAFMRGAASGFFVDAPPPVQDPK